MKRFKLMSLALAVMLMLALAFGSAGIASADEGRDQPVAGIEPDSLLYFFDLLIEKIQLLLASGSREQAVLHAGFAQERLAEARDMLAKGKAELANRTLYAYLDQVKDTARLAVMVPSADLRGEEAIAALRHATEVNISILVEIVVDLPADDRLAYQRETRALLDSLVADPIVSGAKKGLGFIPTDSPFAFLQGWGEEVQVSCAPDLKGKAELRLGFARARLEAAQEMSAQGKAEMTSEAMKAFVEQVQAAVALVQKARAEGEDASKMAEVAEQAVVTDAAVLRSMMEKFSDPQALRGSEALRALEALRQVAAPTATPSARPTVVPPEPAATPSMPATVPVTGTRPVQPSQPAVTPTVTPTVPPSPFPTVTPSPPAPPVSTLPVPSPTPSR